MDSEFTRLMREIEKGFRQLRESVDRIEEGILRMEADAGIGEGARQADEHRLYEEFWLDQGLIVW